MESMRLKIRHILIVILAVLAIAFMQPLVFFLGGLTLLLGAAALIFRDLPPASQDVVEQRVLGWLRRARVGSTSDLPLQTPSSRATPVILTDSRGTTGERPRRVRAKGTAPATVAAPASDALPGPHRPGATTDNDRFPPTF